MKVGFAGSGNMAGALARGLASCGSPPEAMLFADSGSGRAQALAEELGGERAASLEELAEASDLVVLAVKPAGLEAVAPSLAGRAKGVVSVLGATPLAKLEPALAPTPVLRAMPNLAVEICEGVICHTPLGADPGILAEAVELLSGVGSVVEVEERLIDPATAVMGCAPAYIALAAEALVQAGEEAGLDPELSDRLVREATAGVGRHLLTRDPAEMQRAIASPGGSTEAGLDELAERAVHDAYRAAVAASLRRMEGVA
jgi:pyrroline-5-carboxylate reductase